MSAHGAVDALDLRILRIDKIVFIRRVCSIAMAKTELDRRQLQRFAGEHISRPGAGIARPNNRINTIPFIHRGFGADRQGIGRSTRGVVTTGHVHLNISEPAFCQVCL